MPAEYFRAHVGEGNPAVNAMGEQPLAFELRQAGPGFHGIPGLPEAPGLLNVDQPERRPGFPQAFAGPHSFRQLVGAVGYQEQRLAGRRVFVHHQGAMPGQQFGFPGIKDAGPFALRDHHAAYPAPFAEHRWQRGECAVVIGRKQHAGYVVHFPEHAFAEGGVLMRLLILTVLPGMGRGNDRQAKPACRPAHLFLVPGKG